MINHNQSTLLDFPIGSKIKKRVKLLGISNKEFAYKINRSPSTINSIFKSTGINSDLLKTISEVLNYDFFDEYSQYINSLALNKHSEQ